MKEKTRVIFFVGLLMIGMFFNFIQPDRVFSNKENRYLQKFPKVTSKTIISGDFGREFEKYSTDQFIMRDGWISLKTLSDLGMLKKDNARVYFGKDEYLFDIDAPVNEEQKEKNIEYINMFLNNIEANHRDIQVYGLLVPTKSQILNEQLPPYAPIIDEEAVIKNLYEKLNNNIKILDFRKPLEDNKDKYIYYKTDHHWTSEGVFYAYEYFLNIKNERPLDKEDFIVEIVDANFLGTSYRKANFYKGNADEISIYKPIEDIEYTIIKDYGEEETEIYDPSYLDKSDKYSYFLGGDHGIVEIKTSINNNKKILIIKDSFANSFVPFLLNHYEEITIIDPRYFNMGIKEYLQGRDVDEVAIIFNTQSLLSEKGIRVLGQ